MLEREEMFSSHPEGGSATEGSGSQYLHVLMTC
jgi:hypothetical protein